MDLKRRSRAKSAPAAAAAPSPRKSSPAPRAGLKAVAAAAVPKKVAGRSAAGTTQVKGVTKGKRGAKRAVQPAPRRGVTAATRAARARVEPVVRFARVRELDPWARCGPGTSVEQLYRVDEQVDGRAVAVHLVFYDPRGWYCVHGRGCPAVADVHRELRSQRRAVAGAAPSTRAAGR